MNEKKMLCSLNPKFLYKSWCLESDCFSLTKQDKFFNENTPSASGGKYTNQSLLDSAVTHQSGASRFPEQSTVVAALRAGWRRLPAMPPPVWLGLLGLGCSPALAPGHALPQPGPRLPRGGQGHPASSLGYPHLTVSSAEEPTGATLWSLNAAYFLSTGICPLFYLITKGEERVPHLVGFFYTWNITKGFGSFIEAEVHGHRRKGRRQLT